MVNPEPDFPLPGWGDVQSNGRVRAHYFTAFEYGRLLAACGFGPRADRARAASSRPDKTEIRCDSCERLLRGDWGLRDAPRASVGMNRHG
ncbi:MAG: hypothetical protein H0V62_15350 [Gammaproteobacteria bacterium]|nr:hypothetical protein [Gammaproteobacteria bacterium]